MPQTVLDACEFRDIVSLRFVNWVRGTIRTIDCTVILDGKEAMALRDVELEIDAWLDRKTSIHALIVYGTTTLTDAVPGAPAGVHKIPPGQVRVRLRHHRTRLAEEQGRDWLGMFWPGYIDRRCRFDVEGDYPSLRTPNGGENPVSMPLVTWGGGQASNANTALGYYKGATLTGSGTLVPTGPVMAVQVSGEITADLVLARYPVGGSTYGYANGQRLRLVKQFDDGAIRFVKGATPANVCVMATRVLDLAYDWIEFTYNRDRGRWEESGFFSAV